MADSLYELLLPHLDDHSLRDTTTDAYLERLSTLSLKALTSTEDASLSHASQSVAHSLQALSKRSHGSITNASNHLKDLPELLASIKDNTGSIKDGIKSLEVDSSKFEKQYERNTDNQALEKRRTAALLNRSYDRIGNILELPSLLASAVNASSVGANAASTAPSGYASALDMHAHVKRLRALYPNSPLIASVAAQSDTEMAAMTGALISTLQSPNLKLAVAMRTVGWLRRVAPELTRAASPAAAQDEASLSALFLASRLLALRRLLAALDPLRVLADNETPASGGAQSERYLKRFIEVFREHGFAVVSMHRSIFPTALPVPADEAPAAQRSGGVSALAALVPELLGLLTENLARYMPNVTERAARDSLLSQVLFCAGSLGRLGADFGLLLAGLEGGVGADEWSEAVKKHRIQAGRLEVLASGVGGRRASSDVVGSPVAA